MPYNLTTPVATGTTAADFRAACMTLKDYYLNSTAIPTTYGDMRTSLNAINSAFGLTQLGASDPSATIVTNVNRLIDAEQTLGTFPKVIDSADSVAKYPSFIYDVPNGRTMIRRNSAVGRPIFPAIDTFANVFNFTRASSGTFYDQYGVLTTAGTNVLREDFGPLAQMVQNPRALGAVAGTPGTVPNFWDIGNNMGLTRQIVGSGTISGIDYVDVRFYGTAASAGVMYFQLSPVTGARAAQGQTWTTSVFLALLSGTIPNCFVGCDEYNSSLGFLAGSTNSVTVTSSLTRFQHTRAFTNASAYYASPYVTIYPLSGAVLDFTLRIGMPMLSLGSTPPTWPRTKLGVLIEPGATNLLPRSQEFEQLWTLTGLSATANSVFAPDGTLTGDTLTSTVTGAVNSGHAGQLTGGLPTNTTYTYSIFVKRGNTPVTSINFYRTTPYADVWGSIDWTAATPTMTASGAILLGSSFIHVGGGWYRASMTVSTGTATQLVSRVYVRDASTAITTGDNVYVWGGQLEAGTTPTNYIATAGSAVTRSADALTITGSNFSSMYNSSAGTLLIDTRLPPSGTGTTVVSASLSDGTFPNSLYGSIAPDLSAYIVFGQDWLASIGFSSPPQLTKVAFAYSSASVRGSMNGGAVQTDSSVAPKSANSLAIGHNGWSSQNQITGHITRVMYWPFAATSAELQRIST